MSKNPQNSAFHKILIQYGFSTDVSPILQKLDLVTESIPTEENLIEIPDEEIIPIPEIEDETVDDITENDMQKCALNEFAKIFKEKNQLKFLPKVDKNHLKDILLYDDPEEFVQFKREYTTYVKKVALDQSVDPDSITLCNHPTCLNPAIPTLNYCTYHITLDPDYTRFGLFNKCQFEIRGEQCETPCSEKFQNCAIHRKYSKSKK